MNALVRLVRITLSHSSISSASGDLRILMPALLTRISIRPNSRTVRSTISATAALSVTSAGTDIALAPCCLSSATAATDFASLRPTMAMPAPASASPRAMPRPMPPLPPVTIATLPPRSNSVVFMDDIPDECSALALPDQDQAERGQRGAISGPLDLPDHETRLRPVDRASALTDPEQSDGEGQKANDQKRFAHRLFLASRCPALPSRNARHTGAPTRPGQERGGS